MKNLSKTLKINYDSSANFCIPGKPPHKNFEIPSTAINPLLSSAINPLPSSAINPLQLAGRIKKRMIELLVCLKDF